MIENNSPVFLITGCSTGFGREMAVAALHTGFRVIATARRVETLTALQDRGAQVLSLDVTSSVDALALFATTAIAIYGQVDYLVNNAGFVIAGAIEEVSPAEMIAQFNTNFFGLVNTTTAFLPYFRARRAGTLVNISSQGSSLGLPGVGIYAATKAAIDAVSDTWAQELAEYGIRSISVQPGSFRTEVIQTNVRIAEKTIEGYAVTHGTMDFAKKNLAGKEPGDTVKGARNIIALVTRPDALPLRFALGDDAFSGLKTFYEARLGEIEKVRELATGTSYPA
ncbi:short-chain alcohol dehydrogenase [Mycena epipterygia]|nr:short-chain alcohol dehydrogenase [Mycena epipterygia]